MKRIRATALVLCAFSADAALADCTSPVKDAFEKLRASKSFRMETRIVNPQGQLNMTVDYMPPDRMHQRVRLDGSPQEMELIVIGEEAWSNQGQGWVPLPKNFSEQVAKQVKTTLAGATKVEASYVCRPEQTMEGKKVAAYEADLKAPPADEKIGAKPSEKAEPTGPANKQMLYVDPSTGLPVRNVVTDIKNPDKPLFDGWFRTAAEISIVPPETK